jgi:hypothetical protein
VIGESCRARSDANMGRFRWLATYPRCMHIVFLLGSGISINTGMPCVEAISDQVFAGDGVIRNSDKTYGFANTTSRNYLHNREAAEPAIEFTQRLRQLADDYFREVLDGRAANYEDVANLAKQIADAGSGEYENPALLPLLRELSDRAGDVDAVKERATEAHKYIKDVVRCMLNGGLGHADHLAAITDACRRADTVDLFELNHDRVLDHALKVAEVAASDGFTGQFGEAFFWTNEFTRPVRHFKLHGSIDWFSRIHPTEPWRNQVVARSTTADPDHERGETGEFLDPTSEGRPVILVGTFDKQLAYDGPIFADQHDRFHESLRETSALVVIGYGFRDKAINSRLIGWLQQAWNRCLVVVHPKPTELCEGARGAITRDGPPGKSRDACGW